VDRAAYNACVGEGMKGKHLTKDERKLEFCIASKLCSGKAGDRDEAQRLCSLPKPPKEPKLRRHRAEATPAPDDACDLNQFLDVASQFNNVYIGVLGSNCAPCRELDRMIKKTEIPHPVVYVPETCDAILNQLGIEMFPTVVKMSKGKVVAKHEGNPEATIEAMKKGE
jgi:hypothetical protein